ncbi:Virulence protein [Yarrowia sp. C11]|nr:Virulence protein [Yarrowia sp. C11]KAG5364507.1 Virulence protein [Yarrowia sp. E02]
MSGNNNGNQANGNQNLLPNPSSRGPRNLHIAHRRSPSELTPLMVEQIALQQQIDILQAQQQQILAQQQQFIHQPNLMPPPPMQQSYVTATGPFGQFGVQPVHQMGPPQAGGHRRAQSSSHPNQHQQQQPPQHYAAGHQSTPSQSGGDRGHNRRQSLGLPEAIRAAAIEQQKRQGGAGAVPASPQRNQSTGSNSGSFKFPPTSDESPTKSHQRSRSMAFGQQKRTQSPSRFQFPAGAGGHGSSPSTGGNFHPGHGHSRSNSRNFDQGGFVPGHRHRGSSVSSMHAFNSYGGGQQQRKSLFAPYLPQASLGQLMDQGRLVSGVLRVNKKNRSDAYVSTDGILDADIFICGSKDRNRALEGDLVAVELLNVDQVWDSKREKEEKKKRKDQTAGDISDTVETTSSGNASSGGLQRRGSLKQRPQQKRNDDVEVEGQSLLLSEEEELTDAAKPLYAGHIVAVIERVPGQLFSGTLGLLRPSSQATKDRQEREGGHNNNQHQEPPRPKIVWFKPTDKRVPLIAIPTEQAPKDFVENHESYANTLFAASIKRWPITSLHPFGTLVEEIGDANDDEIQIEAILRDNNFTADVFPDSALRAVPEETPAGTALTEEETAGRRDFTEEYTLGLSPNGILADQAFHIKKLGDDKIELGVHVLDVTHYVQSNSALDREAKKRGSSCFLVQRDLNMFPDSFNSNFALTPGNNRLTISVVFEIDATTFDVSDTWIGTSYINTKQKLDYATVERIFDDKGGDDKAQIQAILAEGLLSQTDIDYVKTLRLLSMEFKRDRFNCKNLNLGGKDLPALSLLNQIDDENLPISTDIYQALQISHIVDEVNIKVNCAVAQKLYASLGPKAFLRRHSYPLLQKMESFTQKMNNLGVHIDTSSSGALQKCLFQIESDDVRRGLETLLLKCMNRAKYYVADKSDELAHYFLNVPVYTHFNAPLRRYADLIVHRQLKAVLSNFAVPYDESLELLNNAADYCNFKKDSAHNAQEQSVHLFLSQAIAALSQKKQARNGDIIKEGLVIQVYESAFDVYIPDIGIEKRVHGDQLPLKKAEFIKKDRLLELYWEQGKSSAEFVPENERKGKGRGGDKDKDTNNASNNKESLADQVKNLSLDSKSLPSSPKQSLTGGLLTPHRAISMNKLENEYCARSDGDGSNSDDELLRDVVTREENGYFIQEIRELQRVPIMLRAELGKTLPCLTVRTINPFA